MAQRKDYITPKQAAELERIYALDREAISLVRESGMRWDEAYKLCLLGSYSETPELGQEFELQNESR